MSGAHIPQQSALGLGRPNPAPSSPAGPVPIPQRTRRSSISNVMGSQGSPRRPSTLMGLSPSEQGGILRRRFSSMFGSDGDPGSPRPTFALDHDIHEPEPEPEPFKDRNAIKVKIITWNMADSVPKGDLSVLLGEIPTSAYEVPPKGDEIPELPLEEAHPYHIVVFAAQECPSASGMPRGLGGSLMKGVGLQKSEAARRERDDKKEEQGEKRRQEKEAEKEARKTIREIRKDFLERSTTSAAEKDSAQVLNNLRKEFKEREGPAASLKDLMDRDKDTKDKQRDSRIPGLGISLSGLTEDILEKSKALVMSENSSDSDSASLQLPQANGDHAATKVGGTPVHKEGAPSAPSANGHAGVNTPVTTPTRNGTACQAGETVVPVPDATPSPVAAPPSAAPLALLPLAATSLDGHSTEGSCNSDCAAPAPDPPKSKAVQELSKEQALLSTPPSQQVKEKPSREQLRIDPNYKRKPEPRELSGISRSHFDIGIGSPMSDLAGTIGRRGWSSMLEEWFCAGPPQACRDLFPLASPPFGGVEDGESHDQGDQLISPTNTTSHPRISPTNASSHNRGFSVSHHHASSISHHHTSSHHHKSSHHHASSAAHHHASSASHHRASSVSHHRASSMSHKRSPSTTQRPTSIAHSLQIPSAGNGNGNLGILPIPFGRSVSGQSIQTIDTAASSLFGTQDDRQFGRSPAMLGKSPGVWDSPMMDDSFVKRPYRPPGGGPYVHLIKERLMGLYVHVFVYKGCEHLVEGVDKDFVRTGLARGRIGNKGGIGISLNLKGHRLLFVNAHLAAHTECNDDRVANINKIKNELRPNCFLAPEDPRGAMPDITDRFDTTFWCGDLNFRVDISHLHSKWLLKEQRYIAEAQEWDQLKMVMKDPKKNPLPGFEEAEITFMPTFKYDIWKSVGATNRDKRRSIRRARRSSEQSIRPSIDRPPSPRLHGVPEIDVVEESSSAPESPEIPHSLLHGAQVMSPVPETPPLAELPLPDDLSLASHGADRNSVSPCDQSREVTPGDTSRKSTATHRSERSDRGSIGTNGFASPWEMSPMTPTSQDGRRMSSAWSKATSRSTTKEMVGPTVGATKRSGSMLKAKTQKLMNIMRFGRKPAALPAELVIPDDASRRSSVSSYRSRGLSEGRLSIMSDDLAPPPGFGASSPRMSQSSDSNLMPTVPGIVMPDGEAVHRTSSAQSASAQSMSSISGRRLASPPRRPRSLMRSLSGRDLSEDGDDDESDAVDKRTGVYDTSKKGRIPSWCDRVLWKTHVIPDPIEDPATNIDDDESLASDGPLVRLSNVFSSLSGRMRRRSSFYGDADVPRLSFPRISNSTSAPYGLVASIPQGHPVPERPIAPGQNPPPQRPIAQDQLIVPEQTTPTMGDEAVFESDPPTPAEGELPTSESPEILANAILPSGQASPLPVHIRSLSAPRKRGRSVTFEQPGPLALALRRDLSPTAEVPGEPTAPPPPVPPANGIGLGPSPLSGPHRRASTETSLPPRRQSLARRMSMSSIGSFGSASSRNTSRRRSEDVSCLREPQLHPLKAVRSTGQVGEARPGPRPHRSSDGGLGAGDTPQTGLGALSRFFRALPGRFHSRVSLFHGSEAEVEEPVALGPRRHQVGEVRVLHYGTLLDADMRRLEGRSDHYPLMFSAAIYI